MKIDNWKLKIARKGFSLLELLIVCAIIGIMTAVALVYLGDARKDKNLKTAAREVAAAIGEAQNNALAGKQIGSLAPCNYSFRVLPSGTEYEINHQDGKDSNGDCVGAATQAYLYSLKNDVEFTAASVGKSFAFKLPFGDPNIASPDSVMLTNAGKNISVCVDSSGKIEETEIGGTCP